MLLVLSLQPLLGGCFRLSKGRGSHCGYGKVTCRGGASRPPILPRLLMSKLWPSISRFRELNELSPIDKLWPPIRGFAPPQERLLVVLCTSFQVYRCLFEILECFFISSSVLGLSARFQVVLLGITLSDRFSFVCHVIYSLRFTDTITADRTLTVLAWWYKLFTLSRRSDAISVCSSSEW